MAAENYQSMITGKTKIFGVIADPIDHVRAPMSFNSVFADRGIDAVLIPIHLKPEILTEQMKALVQMPNMGGVCVTIPFKLDVAKICDELGNTAKITGAVNAVRFEHGKMIGDNFDGKGFTAGLIGEGVNLSDKSVLMIGAGGAARAIAVALSEQPIQTLGIANRTASRAKEIKAIIQKHHPDCNIEEIPHDTLDHAAGNYDIIVNTTSLGLRDGDAMPCQFDHVRDEAVIVDIIMIPEVTEWLKKAQEKGLRTHAGRHMLDYQCELIGHFIGAIPEEKQ
jgi:shikimate dehydrogenase